LKLEDLPRFLRVWTAL